MIHRNREWAMKLPQTQNRFLGIGGCDGFTKLLVHGNPPSGSSAFLDATPNLHPIKSVASIVSDNSQSVLGLGSSAYFVAASGQYLVCPDSADWYFGDGDITLDCQVRMNGLPAAAAAYYLVAQYQDANNYWYWRINHPNTGAIQTIHATPTDAGLNYVHNDLLTVTTGDGTATVRVNTVNAITGAITAMYTVPVSGGTGYSAGTGQATTGGSGDGTATINVTVITATEYKLHWTLVTGSTTRISNNVIWSGAATATWFHLAMVRYGNVWSQYANGTLVGTASTTAYTMPDLASSLYIGSLSTTTTNSLNGWMNELRISKGIARYTANFTPAVTPYTVRNW